MHQLIADFQVAIKILMWRVSKTRRYNDPIFLNGLKYASTVGREKKVREILESVDSKHLTALSKYNFIKPGREFSALLTVILTERATEINSALQKLRKTFDG